MRNIGGYIILGLLSIIFLMLVYYAFGPIFFNREFFPWPFVIAGGMIGVIYIGAKYKVREATFEKPADDED